MKQLKLYTQPNCGLCDDAKIQLNLISKELASNGFTIIEKNIQNDDALLLKYMMRVPVLVYDMEVIQEGQIDFVTVLDKIESLT